VGGGGRLSLLHHYYIPLSDTIKDALPHRATRIRAMQLTEEGARRLRILHDTKMKKYAVNLGSWGAGWGSG
jgi:hypothetical protein